ncbi:MAG: PEP-CTERM system histidine kinase PrsK, partial [Gammaproteobacteria bacterium]|nr:PEP-CTERM system histidine kinase PrsK [Gammaproteobacteria bacterium]
MSTPPLILAAVGYGLAALAYLGLSGLIVASWRQRAQGRLLVLATGLSAAWGMLSTFSATGWLPPQLGLVAEIARNGAWLALLLYILHLRLPPGASLPAPLRLIRVISAGIVSALLLVSLVPDLAAVLGLPLRGLGNMGMVL